MVSHKKPGELKNIGFGSLEWLETLTMNPKESEAS